MEKRIFIAVLISIAFLWLWAAVAPKLFPNLIKPKSSVTAPKQAPAKTTPTATSTITSVPTNTVVEREHTPEVPTSPVAAESIQYTTIDEPEFTARFSNRGAELISFQLK